MSLGTSTTAAPCATTSWLASGVRNLCWALALAASPALAQTGTIHFAAFGDFGNGAGANAVADLVKSQAPDFIVTVGDNCYGKLNPISIQVGNKYAAFVDSGRFWPALGNHEYSDGCGGPGAANYFAYFSLPNNERYYDFVSGPVHFFVLNSNSTTREPDGRTPTSIQGQWLKAQLAASTARWQVVVFHHAPFSTGTHGSIVAMRWPFEAWGADAVFTGHDHDYERIVRDDNADGVKLPYFVTGLGGQAPRSSTRTPVSGSQIFYAGANGALFVTASSTAMNFEFRNTSGAVIDSYSIPAGSTARRPKRSKGPLDWRVCC